MSITGKWFGFGKSETYDQGMRAYDRGEFEVAIEHFRIAVGEHIDPPTERLARFFLVESFRRHADQLIAAGQAQGALESVREAITHKPGYADLSVLEARALDAMGRSIEALEAIDRALDLNPKYAEARFWRGVSLYALGQRDEGLDAVRDALERFRGRVPNDYGAALGAHENGDFDEALKHLRSISLQESDETGALIRKGDDMVGQGAFSEAAACYHSALEASPNYADVRCKYGQVLAELDDLDGAIAQFKKALEINSRYAEAMAQLGIIYKRKGMAAEAKTCFEGVLQINPHHPIASMEVGRR